MMLKTAIIGCGNIAGGYDRKVPEKWSATHAGAYHLCDKTQLVAIADSDSERLKKFQNKWQVENGYQDWKEMLDKEAIDILSICLPTEYHFDVFETAVQYPLKAIFLEKPLSDTMEKAKKMLSCQDGPLVSVNYFRRWNPTLADLAVKISQGQYGRPLSATIHYNKGLLVNGSHFIDLMRWFFGEPAKTTYIRTPGTEAPDPGIDFRMDFDSGFSAHFVNVTADYYNFAQVDILMETQRLVIEQRGQMLSMYPVIHEPHYGQFDILGKCSQTETNWRNCVTRAVQELAEAVGKGVSISCTLEDGFRVMEICNDIKNQEIQILESA